MVGLSGQPNAGAPDWSLERTAYRGCLRLDRRDLYDGHRFRGHKALAGIWTIGWTRVSRFEESIETGTERIPSRLTSQEKPTVSEQDIGS